MRPSSGGGSPASEGSPPCYYELNPLLYLDAEITLEVVESHTVVDLAIRGSRLVGVSSARHDLKSGRRSLERQSTISVSYHESRFDITDRYKSTTHHLLGERNFRLARVLYMPLTHCSGNPMSSEMVHIPPAG